MNVVFVAVCIIRIELCMYCEYCDYLPYWKIPNLKTRWKQNYFLVINAVLYNYFVDRSITYDCTSPSTV